jgi:hypothetical protein
MRKTTIIISVLLIVASLSIGINIGIFLAQQPPRSPNTTSIPSPTEMPSYEVICTYRNVSIETIGENTRVILSVTTTAAKDTPVTINYTDFLLTVFYPLGGQAPYAIQTSDNYRPLQVGTVTLDESNKTTTFQLTFQIPTKYHEEIFTNYALQYCKNLDGDPYFMLID